MAKSRASAPTIAAALRNIVESAKALLSIAGDYRQRVSLLQAAPSSAFSTSPSSRECANVGSSALADVRRSRAGRLFNSQHRPLIPRSSRTVVRFPTNRRNRPSALTGSCISTVIRPSALHRTADIDHLSRSKPRSASVMTALHDNRVVKRITR